MSKQKRMTDGEIEDQIDKLLKEKPVRISDLDVRKGSVLLSEEELLEMERVVDKRAGKSKKS